MMWKRQNVDRSAAGDSEQTVSGGFEQMLNYI